MTLTDEQLRSAIATGHAFWDALAGDDDGALLSLLTANVIAILAQGDIIPGPIYVEPQSLEAAFRSPGDGIAARLRAHLGAEFEIDGLPGLASNAELLEGDQLRFAYPVVGARMR